MVVVLDDMPEIGKDFLCRFGELLAMYKVLCLDGRLLKLSDLFKTALSFTKPEIVEAFTVSERDLSVVLSVLCLDEGEADLLYDIISC